MSDKRIVSSLPDSTQGSPETNLPPYHESFLYVLACADVSMEAIEDYVARRVAGKDGA